MATLDDPRDYGNRFSRVADTLVSDIDSHVDAPDREDTVSSPGRYLYAQYAVANRFAAAAPALVRRVEDALDA